MKKFKRKGVKQGIQITPTQEEIQKRTIAKKNFEEEMEKGTKKAGLIINKPLKKTIFPRGKKLK